ncbi:O-antigen ligase family protein [Vibrio rumoiensis]|uniref:O-antigen ligase family protein n=1 Tax=Vibrio rumoiensis TaxID=76258 RepID=A0ABW7IVR8_9VIBR
MKTMVIQPTLINVRYYPQFLLSLMLVGSVLLSFTPYWLDPTTLFDTKRFFVIFYLLLTALVMLCSGNIRNAIIDSFLNQSSLSKRVILLAVTCALFANITALYWVKSQAVFTYGLMFIVVTALLRHVVAQNNDLILRLYIWLTCSLFVSVFLFHSVATWQGEIPNYRYIFSFVNPRNINHIQIWLILPLLYWAWQNRLKPKAWLYALPVIMHFSLLLTLDARGAFIASMGGILLWLILSPNKAQRFKWLLALLFLGLLMKWLLFSPLPQYWLQGVWPEGQGEIRLSDSNRLALWRNAIAMLSFWGHGGDTFVCNNDVIAHTTHNSVLNIAIEWGVVATLCYISLLLLTFYRVCTCGNEKRQVLGITVLSGFAYSLISGVLNTPLSQGLAAISVALFWATNTELTNTKLKASSLPSTSTVKKMAHGVLILLSVWAIAFIGYKTFLRIDNNQYRHVSVDYYMPQFWIEHNCMDVTRRLNLPASH